MGNEHNEQFQPDPKFFERIGLFQDTLNCKKTDKILAAPMIMYLPINH